MRIACQPMGPITALAVVLVLSILLVSTLQDQVIERRDSPMAIYPFAEQLPEDEPPLGRGNVTSGFFTENRGQAGPGGGTLYSQGPESSIALGIGWVAHDLHPSGDGAGALVRIELVGAAQVIPEGRDELPYACSYIIGNDSNAWVRGACNFREVVYRQAWAGIDIVFGYQGGLLKYDVVLQPGADVNDAGFRYSGIEDVTIDPCSGRLVLTTAAGILAEEPPLAFQQVGAARRPVSCAFTLVGADIVSFELDRYEPDLPVVIDPAVVYSTFLGARDDDDGRAVISDTEGNTFVAGCTRSPEFPTTPGAYDRVANSEVIFVTELDLTGEEIVYSTFVGGGQSGRDVAIDMALDDYGRVYVTGTTTKSDFPTTDGAYCRTYAGGGDCIVFTLDANGSALGFSSMIGGLGEDFGCGICLDDRGRPVVAGYTFGKGFPSTLGSWDTTANGAEDGFVLRLDKDGSRLVDSTFIGGASQDVVIDVCLDTEGNIYLAGKAAGGFPTTSDAYDSSYAGSTDMFVTKMDSTCSRLLYSTYLGGPEYDVASDIAVDGEGRAVIAGHSGSTTFPTTAGCYDPSYNGGQDDAVVLRLDGEGRLDFSTFIGGRGWDRAHDLALAEDGTVWVTGFASAGLPTTVDAYQRNHGGSEDAFVLQLSKDGEHLPYCSYIGGTNVDEGIQICLDSLGGVIVTGWTRSTNFPTTEDAAQPGIGGGSEAFVIKLLRRNILLIDKSADAATTGDRYTFRVRTLAPDRAMDVRVEHWFDVDATHENVSMTLYQGTDRSGMWEFAIDIPHHSLAPLHYFFSAVDSEAVRASTSPRTVRVLDDDRPVLGDLTPGVALTGELLTFMAEVNDNIGVHEARVAYSLPGHPEDNVTMVCDSPAGIGNGTYVLTIPLPDSLTDAIDYSLWAEDTSGNWASTDIVRIDIMDGEPPRFIEDLTMRSARTDEPFSFGVNASDNVAVAAVAVVHWLGEDAATNQTMSGLDVDTLGNGVYTWGIPTLPISPVNPIHYFFWAVDRAGNSNRTSLVTLAVLDVSPAVFVSLRWSEPTTGDLFRIEAVVVDNVGLATLDIHFDLDDGTTFSGPMTPMGVSPNGSGSYSFKHIIPSGYLGLLRFNVTATDIAGNTASSAQELRVRDDDAPWFGVDATTTPALKGCMLTFSVEVFDNIGVDSVTVLYSFGPGPALTTVLYSQTSWTGTTEVPRHPAGRLSYQFRARDLSGNENTSLVRFVKLINIPPSLGQLPVWNVVESERTILDLSPYITDDNDVTEVLSVRLVPSSHAKNISVEGHGLVAFYDDWVPEHQVMLVISDGEDETMGQLIIKVINVNDPPNVPIILLPSDGASLLEGSDCEFLAMVWDPDISVGDELMVTWTSDIDGDLYTTTVEGEHGFTYAGLSPGRHVIRVTVTDGEASRNASVGLTVIPQLREPEPPPFFRTLHGVLLLVLLIVGTITAIVIYYHKRRGRFET